ncbi:MAG: nucleotidyltransferase domain-containing protein [Lentisphaerae bacterium]|nr:nucleotidyltransferase domain-containing protein [Lentisphaerota bacterium]
MNRTRLQRNIRQVVDQVVALAHPRRVILFGSAASGQTEEGSDLDFLVVVRGNARLEELTDRLNMGIRDRPMPCDFMVVTEAMLDRQRDNPGLVYGEILAQGKEVYAI